MTWQHITYFISIIITAAVMGFIAWYAGKNRNVVASSWVFMWISFLVSLLSIFQGISMFSPSMEQALFWFNVRFVSLAAIPVLWLVFVLYYIEKPGLVSKPRIALLFVIPVVTQIMLWTNDMHHLWVVHDVAIRQAGPFFIPVTAARVLGPWMIVHNIYGYGMLLAGVVILFASSARLYRRYRGQAVALGAGSLIMIIGTLFPTFNFIPGMVLNPLPQSFALGSLVIAWGLYRHRFLGEKPLVDREKKIPMPLIALFTVLTVGIMTAGFVYYSQFREHQRTSVEEDLSSIAGLKVNEIVQWRKERLADGDTMYGNAVFNGLALRFLADPADAGARWGLESWLGNMQASYRYHHVQLLDARGSLRLSVPRETGKNNGYISQHIDEVRKSGKVEIIDFHRDAPDEPIYLSVIVPLTGGVQGSGPAGFVVLFIDPEEYLYPLIKRWPTPSRSAETLLVRRDGDDALFLNELRFRKNAALNLKIPLKEMQLPAVRVVQGQEGYMEGIDYRGVPVVAVTRSVPGSPWFMVARMDTDEVYAPVRERFWVMVIVVMVLIAGAGAGVGLLWRRQGERLIRERLDAAEAIRASEVRYRRLFEAAKDGILILDAETGMIVDVNPFLIEMLGFSHEQFLGKTIWDIGFFKDIIPNKDKFLELQEKKYVRYEDLPLETADGRSIDVEFVSNLYEIGHGKVIQCNIRDITERLLMQKSLAEISSHQKSLLSAIPDIVMEVDVNKIYTWVNGPAIEFFGDDVIGREAAFYFEGEQDTYQSVQPIFNGDEDVIYLESWQQRRDGEKRLLAWWCSELKNEKGELIGALSSARDITERKRAEENELRIKALLSETERVGKIGGWEFDVETLAQKWTEQTFAILEIDTSRGEPKVPEGAGFIAPQSRPMAEKAIQRAIEYGEPYDQEWEVVTAKGNKRWVHSVARVNRENDKIKSISGSFQDITERKRAEEALKESEDKFRGIFEYSTVGKSLTAPDGTLLQVNRAFADMLGYTIEELQRVNFAEITHPDDIAESRESIRCLLANERDFYRMEKRYFSKDKSIVWADVSTRLHRDEKGKPEYLITSIVDITGRKRAEEATRQETEFIKATLDSLPGLFYLFDKDGRFLRWNNNFEKISGYTAEEISRMSPLDFFESPERELVAETIKEVFISGIAVVEAEFISKDRTRAPHLFTGNLFSFKGMPSLIGMGIDITERIQAEKELRIKDQVFEDSLGAQSVADIGGTITHVNPAFLRMWGYATKEMAIGNSVGSFFSDPAEAKAVLEALADHDAWEGRFRAKRADGGIIISHGYATTMRDSGGAVIGYQSTNLDITAQNEAENQVKLYAAELERSNVDLQQFAYVASHDLQEPLRMISSYLQLIEKRYKDRLDQDANDFINYAVDGAVRLQMLISGLLEFSRIRTHGKPFTSVNVNDVLDGMRKDLEVQIEESGATVNCGAMPVIQADEVQMARLFQNLVQNAIKFRREGTPSLIDITADAGSDEYVFCVRDNGIGIEEKYLERIFIIFQRLHSREEYPGTGIGLSICKRIVERHGGRIWVESKPGEGSAFYFSIPAA